MNTRLRRCSLFSAGLLLLGVAVCVQAQVAGPDLVALKVSGADRSAVASATRVHRKAKAVSNADVGIVPAAGNESLSTAQAQALANFATLRSASPANAGSAPRYPGDLFNFGGATVTSAKSHNIYVNPDRGCPAPGCWGNPGRYLADLGNSDFIHVVDQYTGVGSDRRYTTGVSYTASYPAPAPAYTDDDILAIVHAAAARGGQSGYGHIYHVFLRPGVDECFDSSLSTCYSPDNFNTWYFCAYHSSADFADVGHVLYSVEPYQNVSGCWVAPGTPNGRLADSTNDTLSHEFFETVTDPDGDGWWQYLGSGMFGQEIGDECVFLAHLGDGSSAPSYYRAGGNPYATQPEYDNSAHGCTVKPGN